MGPDAGLIGGGTSPTQRQRDARLAGCAMGAPFSAQNGCYLSLYNKRATDQGLGGCRMQRDVTRVACE